MSSVVSISQVISAPNLPQKNPQSTCGLKLPLTEHKL